MKYLILFFIVSSLISCKTEKDTENVIASGSLKNVMQNGDLSPHLNSDSLTISDDLYGLGPAENMQGELIIIRGDIYKSIISKDGSIKVERINQFKAPFYVHGYFKNFELIQLPDSSKTSINSIETFLNKVAENRNLKTFCFKIKTSVISSKIHVLNFNNDGIQKVTKKAIHQSNKNFEISNDKIEIIGFYSTSHHGIFTHHDSNIHMHLITKDKAFMGHVDEIKIDPNFQSEILISK